MIVDEAQEFRKLSFATNRLNLKGVSPDGSQRAWDLFVKARFVETKNPGRALIQASGTPITNTLGELFTILRMHDEDALRARGVHEFDAWASTFGDTRTELELQPSGTYKPVERFSTFINVPELIDMFRNIADVVVKDDLRDVLTLPRLVTGQRQLITAPASPVFRDYQKMLARRIQAIEQRIGAVKPGDDIDRFEVRRIGRQVAQLGFGRLDRPARLRALLGGRVVRRGDGARVHGRNQHVIEIGLERGLVHRGVERHRRFMPPTRSAPAKVVVYQCLCVMVARASLAARRGPATGPTWSRLRSRR